jgi:benzoyl-CoA reductase/2-hydroxyglutaryl-CoA dehydratase subunit BcrC/BadD/HgdB
LELLKKARGKLPKIDCTRKVKLLWLHLFPYYQNSLMKYVENELGCCIVFEEINYVPRKNQSIYPNTYSMTRPLSEEQPFESMAEKLILTPIHGPIETRLQNLEDMLNRYSFDGAIHFSHIGCKPSTGDVRFIKDFLNKNGVPFLEIIGDNIDYRSTSYEQIKTRIEAFVEMLR